MSATQTYQQFVESLKALGDKDKQIQTIMQYFMDNVEYDYDFFDLDKLQNHAFDIEEKYDCKDPEQREKAMEFARKEYNISDDVIRRVEEHYGQEYTMPAKPYKPAGENEFMSWSEQPARPESQEIRNLPQAIQLALKFGEEKDGLLTKGLCSNFSPFIKQICKDLDIPCTIVRGTTAHGHQWNAIKGSDEVPKHYDITYAMFIRDFHAKHPYFKNKDVAYNGWTEKVKSDDWFALDDDKLSELHPIREFPKLDNKVVGVVRQV